MTHILHLRDYPSMRAACQAHTDLLAAFKKAHKRGENVELYVGSSGDPKGIQVHSLRAYYTKEHEAEALWFKEGANR